MRLVASWNIMVNKCCAVGCCCNYDGKITVPTLDKMCWQKSSATKLYFICCMYQPVRGEVLKYRGLVW